MIRASTARKLFYSWHGGQWSPLYAAASSGLVENWEALKHEVRECYVTSTSRKEQAELARLLDWVIDQQIRKAVNRIVIAYGVRYNALPWANYKEV